MKYLIVLTVAIICFTACQSQVGNIKADDSAAVSKHMPDTSRQAIDSVKTVGLQNGTQCFAYTKNKDTIFMQLLLKDTLASGNLIYNLYEKDKNKGTFAGKLTNDTLIANYTFSSEGTRSVRQVAFLLRGNILLSGNGSMKEQYNRLVFTNKNDITFDANLTLEPIDCSDVKFK